ncbi:MAG: hypothetical protein DMG13_11510 [Acidobacteria bacterium]|nr:MAG: hypothetical protein DMG13_11510 [Acidobacteriota bacterium]
MYARKVLALFDFDKTLIHGDSFRSFSMEASATALERVIVYSLAVACWLGLIGNKTYKEQVLRRVWAGVDASQREQFLKGFFSRLHERENPRVVAELMRHLRENHTVAVLSASPGFYLEPFVHSWSQDIRVFASQARFAMGGPVVDNLYGEPKTKCARELIEQLQPELIVIYTDNISDLGLIQLATHTRLVAPSRQLTRALERANIAYEVLMP